MKSRNSPGAFAAATVVAVGVAIVWGFLAAVGGGAVADLFRVPLPGEDFIVDADGRPLVRVRPVGGNASYEYYDLDRNRTDDARSPELEQANLPKNYVSPAIFADSLNWNSRIAGFSSNAEPFAAWYLVRDADRPGSAHFELYDARSKLHAGYFGRRGFVPDAPPAEDRFDLRDLGLGTGYGAVVRAQRWSPTFVNYHEKPLDVGPFSGWFIYLVDGDRVVRIDTRDKSLRTVATVPGLLGIARLTEPLPEEDRAGLKPAVDQWGRPVAVGTRPRLAARGRDAIYFIDPEADGEPQRFPVPAAFLDEYFTAYSPGDGTALLTKSPDWRTATEDVVAVDAAGRVRFEKTLRYQRRPANPAWLDALGMAGAAPVTAGWAIAWPVIRPLQLLDERRAETYASALSISTAESGVGFAAVVLVSASLAVFLIWRHRSLHRGKPTAWAVFVFLLGPAGLLTYFVFWRDQPFADCPSCGLRVPRDGVACPACGAVWPRPEPLGTEIFAA